MADVVVPMGEGVLAFENEEYARAVDVLWPLRDRWFGIGGSHAQRDIFTQILIEAAIRAERYEQARALLAQRALLRPNQSWEAGKNTQQCYRRAATTRVRNTRCKELLACTLREGFGNALHAD